MHRELRQRSEPASVSHVSVSAGPLRTKFVSLPMVSSPVPMGMHGDVAAHYGLSDNSYEPNATTIDYFVGAVVACLSGTFGGMLVRLGQSIDNGRLSARGDGETTNVRGTLRVSRIYVEYTLELGPGVNKTSVVDAHRRHVSLCPLGTTIQECVSVETDLVFK